LLLLLAILRRRGSGRRSRDILITWSDVERSIDSSRDGQDFGTEFLLNPVEIEPIFVSDEVDCKTQVSKTTTSTDTVQVRLSVLGKIEVDDDVNGLDIDTTGKKIYFCANTHCSSEYVPRR